MWDSSGLFYFDPSAGFILVIPGISGVSFNVILMFWPASIFIFGHCIEPNVSQFQLEPPTMTHLFLFSAIVGISLWVLPGILVFDHPLSLACPCKYSRVIFLAILVDHISSKVLWVSLTEFNLVLILCMWLKLFINTVTRLTVPNAFETRCCVAKYHSMIQTPIRLVVWRKLEDYC